MHVKRVSCAAAMILTGMRCNVAHPWSSRHLDAMMHERAVSVDHATMTRSVLTYAPHLEEAF